jgi:hypothetical protein
MEVSGQLHAPAALSPGKEPLESESRSGRGDEEKNSQPKVCFNITLPSSPRSPKWSLLMFALHGFIIFPSQPPTQSLPRVLSRGAKRPGREADDSPPSSAEVKNAWSSTSTHQHVFMAWCPIKQWMSLQLLILRDWIVITGPQTCHAFVNTVMNLRAP